MSESHGFEGGKELGFTGERGGRPAREEEDDARPGAWAPRGRARGQRTRGVRDRRVRRGLGRLGWAGTRPRWEGAGRPGPGRPGGEGGTARERDGQRIGGEREGGREDFGPRAEREREDFGPDLALSKKKDMTIVFSF
jgi:hypothetical protein